MSNKLNLMAVGAALVVGLAGGYLLFGGSEPPPSGTGESQAVAERKPLFYRNAMNPTVTSPIPAKDSMGMDYIGLLFANNFIYLPKCLPVIDYREVSS